MLKVKHAKPDKSSTLNHKLSIVNAMKTTGEIIRELRKSAGLSQLQLSNKTGITKSAISQIETGETKSLKGSTLTKIASALGVTPEEIQYGKKRKQIGVSEPSASYEKYKNITDALDLLPTAAVANLEEMIAFMAISHAKQAATTTEDDQPDMKKIEEIIKSGVLDKYIQAKPAVTSRKKRTS